MAEITAALVKALREQSGAGMMDCKGALTETGGDIDAAMDWLRTKGLSKAAKKAGRVASEGLIAAMVDGTKGVVVEVNSETDFVARNEAFQDLVRSVANVGLENAGDFDTTNSAPFPGASENVKDHITAMVGTIGENLSFRRSAGLSVGDGVVASYVHGQIVPGLGKIGVLIALESEGDKQVLSDLARNIAMHVAAASPQVLTVEELDAAVVERERAVAEEQTRASGKPEKILDKIVDNRMKKFYEEVVLLNQIYVMDTTLTVQKVVDGAVKEAGAPIKLAGYVRFLLGEGVEKVESDFAAEVAAAAGTA